MSRIVIGGVAYGRPASTTFDQDIFVMETVRAAGLDRLQVGAHESARDFVDRLQVELLPVMLPILSGLLVPEGAEWSRDVAASSRESFANTSNPSEKAALRAQAALLLADFFAKGIASAMISPNSSAEGAIPKESEDPAPTATGLASSG